MLLGEGASEIDSMVDGLAPRCKSRQGWFRSLRRAIGGWWPRAECLR